MKIFVNQLCIACHRCYVEFPEVFQRDAEGYAHPVSRFVNDRALSDMALDAAETCPVGAIRYEE